MIKTTEFNIIKNMTIKGGATIWARQTIDSDIFYWRPDKWFKIWFFIINEVNHTDNKLFKRGTNFMTYEKIAQYTKATRNQIDGFLRFGKRSLMITTQKTTRGMVLTVLKYDHFQDLDNYKNDTENDKENETQTKHKRHYKQECKNDKNNKNSETSSPEINQKEEEKLTKADINKIIEYFISSLKNLREIDYVPNWGKDTKILKSALDTIRTTPALTAALPATSFEQAKILIDYYLTTKKSKENDATFSACFSNYALNSYLQNYKKIKSDYE